MRPLHVSIAIAASAVLLAACEDGTHVESAASHARDSSLAHDLELAADSSVATRMAGLDTHAVTESPGMLDASADSTATGTSRRAQNAANVSARAAPSAEGYVGPSCASPARDDQQRCLLGYLAKSDALLDRYFQALILRLQSEAGARSSTTEPAAVQRLRTAQRAWLAYRDDECRKRSKDREGPLWAPVRAQCLAEYSALRARELDDALAKRKAVAPREQPARSKRSSGRKSTRRTRG
ncbi:MAG: lysozyme inhibitor LprI family protein [Gemmatimonadaceae bacterium]